MLVIRRVGLCIDGPPMRPKHLLIGNWKMNLGPSQAAVFARELRAKLPQLSRTDVWVAPPATSLSPTIEALTESEVLVGAQNVHWATSGAFTGETSPSFLTELGARFSLVGHSERRTYFGETSERTAERMKSALHEGLSVVVCIGETESERVAGATEQILQDQLAPVFEKLTDDESSRVIIAYEPVWAIGTGRVASIEEIASTHRFIESLWRARGYSHPPVLLYGGSVNPTNFGQILILPEVDGALVGGASIKLDQWLQLIEIAEATPVQ